MKRLTERQIETQRELTATARYYAAVFMRHVESQDDTHAEDLVVAEHLLEQAAKSFAAADKLDGRR